MTPFRPLVSCAYAALTVLAAFATHAQSPAPAEPRPADATPAETRAGEGPLATLGWLPGCYRGTANQREFREQWLPLRGDLLVGASHTVLAGKTQDFSHMRIEPRADGVYYVITPSRQPELAFRLTGQEADGPDRVFTFSSGGATFPQRIVYRRATGGWLYIHVEGPVGGEERRVIYPMRRIDCEGGEFIDQ
jgi:hypothetical protein